MEGNIGVFLCNCGGAIRNIDFDAAAKKVGEFPGVTSVNLSADLCLDEGRRKMLSHIRTENIERVVVAACSPDFTESIFRQVLEKAALNVNLLVMANVREQCSWAHGGDVTEKAVELVKMAVYRVRLLQPLEKKESTVSREVLVVGGGLSAISSALQLARLGLRTTLLEKGTVLGDSSQEWGGFNLFDAASTITAAETDENVEVLTSAQVMAIDGRAGDFTVRIRKGDEDVVRKYGAIVLAAGHRTQLFLDSELQSDTGLVSHEQFWRMLRNHNPPTQPKTVGFMFDFYDENARFPALAALHGALEAKKRWGSEVFVLCRGVKVDSEGAEELYREARNCGVVFVKCDSPPKIGREDGRIRIEARDVFVGEDLVLSCDTVVGEELCLPAREAVEVSSLLGLRRDSKGFCQDENVHLYPVRSERRGIFLVGECRGDLDIRRTAADVSSAVAGVYQLLSSGRIVVDVDKVRADPQKCVACLTCIRVCPHGAIQLVRADNSKQVAGISDVACYACGVCAAICPAKAIRFQGYRDEEILAQIEAIGESLDGRHLAFCCEHSAYPAADLAGKLGLRYARSVRIIRVPCAGQVDVIHVLKALENGAAAVLVMGCEEGACHHIVGSTRARERVRYCNALLREVGVEGRPVSMVNLSPNAPHKFVRAVDEIGKLAKEPGR